ncbi:hypothetical protein ACFWY5_48630 [Nonomuraea sp. NPDC059007]|uniref:hypothetical protein n=1 Tax=Nonomuraea sp. NPDC059007 TaxID=3346692 RepID=UPI00369A4B11
MRAAFGPVGRVELLRRRALTRMLKMPVISRLFVPWQRRVAFTKEMDFAHPAPA